MSSAADTMPSGPAALSDDDVTNDLQALTDAVTTMNSNASDAELIDRIAALERLKSACAAAQARLTATFIDSQTADAAARHHRPDAARRSIAGQIALARRDSPFAGRRHVGVASALVTDMPHTLAALTRGELSERRARIIVEQLACLTPQHRREADRLLAPDMASMGDRTAETRAAAMAYRLDPETVMAKIRGAVKDRHVSVRPAPDAMSRLSALLPVSLGVAVYASLNRAAAAVTATPGGDPRSRGQLMADALVSAVTGHTITGCDPYGVPQYGPAAGTPAAPQTATDHDDPAGDDGTELNDTDDEAATSAADAATTADTDTAMATFPTAATAAAATADTAAADIATDTGTGTSTAAGKCSSNCGISINLVMTDRTLLDSDDEPAYLHGHGPIPAALARALVIGAADTGTRTFIRRLYTDPVTGQLAQMDSRRRLFPPAAQRFLLARDQTCRTPWCDAPIRQYDHVQSHADGGPTTVTNGDGQCQSCNLTKSAPRWLAATTADGTITTTVPTGHRYNSRPPRPPRSAPWGDICTLEGRIVELLLAA